VKKLIFLLTVFCCVDAAAQPEFVKKIGRFIDSMSVKGLDRNYIDAPEKPWQVMVQGNINQSNLKMKSQIDGSVLFDDVKGILTCEPHVKPPVSSYVGFWAGYRGYGIGYSVNVGGDKGSIFKIGATGGSYGINLRIHRFETDQPSVFFEYDDISGDHVTFDGHYILIDPMSVKIVNLDAYYLFNGKRFSYCAAYDQSVFQKRSAGSFMVGAMYYKSTITYDYGLDGDFVMMMGDIGKIKQYQFAVGPGYAYNFVPCKGLLISALAMPMITLSNKVDVWNYNSDLRKKSISGATDLDYPSDFLTYPAEGEDKIYFPVEKDFKETYRSNITIMFDARLSITYNVGNWFFNTNAQFNRFRFKLDSTQGNLSYWYVNACVGVRL
jgi:hypothetical protein